MNTYVTQFPTDSIARSHFLFRYYLYPLISPLKRFPPNFWPILALFWPIFPTPCLAPGKKWPLFGFKKATLTTIRPSHYSFRPKIAPNRTGAC